MKAILSHPALYQAYQNVGGFFGARVRAVADYLTLCSGMRIIDIGCGPGYILRHLPRGIDYVGFDIDQAYIEHARRSFGHLGKFHCRYFDAAAASEFAGADIVMISSVQLLVLGLIGEYVGRTYIQSKNRPLFMISHIHRRPRLPRRLPYDPAPSRSDSEKSPSKASRVSSDVEEQAQLVNESSR
ncbi:MAG: class I SAM-dependent methyltransferase [Alphaproteobacteria bacterium]|nr:MAG: class I SAM-dependent methyltransferase [Alphaproteobacteria bacterium]